MIEGPTVYFPLPNMLLMRSRVVIPLREASYILYVDQATNNVSAVNGKVTSSHLIKANEEKVTPLLLF
jgi:hypothetical protein